MWLIDFQSVSLKASSGQNVIVYTLYIPIGAKVII